MARQARVVLAGIAYHCTQRGTDGRRVFFRERDRILYLRMLRRFTREARLRVLAYCLMTNHVHLVVVPEEVDSLEIAFRRCHGRYAQWLNALRERTGHLWQGRYFSCPMDENHLWAGIRYVEYNPVRAGLVERPEDFRWSSARAHLTGKDRSGVLDLDFWRAAGGSDRWQELLASPADLLEMRRLQKCTFGGRPFGSEQFIGAVEQATGRRWRRESQVMTAMS